MHFFQNPCYIKQFKQLNYDEQLNYVNKILSHDPKNSLAWYLKGTFLLEKKDIESALLCIDTAIVINPQDKIFRYKKGIILQVKGAYDEAIASCDEAIKLDQNYKVAIKKKLELFNIKLCLFYREKFFEKALYCCNQILILQANNKQALLIKDYLLQQIKLRNNGEA